MASIKDVAQKAGVGVGTVSRVLNNSGYVSEDTREKIEQAMNELQYTPNELARNLFHKKSGIIAIIVPSVEVPFFAELVHNIEEELYKVREVEHKYLQSLKDRLTPVKSTDNLDPKNKYSYFISTSYENLYKENGIS